MRRAASSATRLALHSRRAIHSQSLPTPVSPSVRITTLPNRIRVATEDVPGHFAGVGLYVDAGSRYETSDNSGVSHFLDRMAFKVSRPLPCPMLGSDLARRARAIGRTSKCRPQYMLLADKFSALLLEKL